MELNDLFKRCLCLGIVVLPYELKRLSIVYEGYKLDSETLWKMHKEDVERYKNALYLMGEANFNDFNGGWGKGKEMLKEFGFFK